MNEILTITDKTDKEAYGYMDKCGMRLICEMF